MSSSTYNFSNMDHTQLPNTGNMRIGIVVSEWNDNITSCLLEGCVETLLQSGVKEENILVKYVPGTFELVYGCSIMAQSKMVESIVAIGCVIKGDTPHFDYICQAATQGICDINAKGDIPVVFGILTCSNLQQAEERSSGLLGNKGKEFALTAIKMLDFMRVFKK